MKSWTDSPGKLFAVAAMIVAVIASVVVWWSNRQGSAVEQAHFVGPGRVILVRRPAALFGSDHLAQLLEVDTTTGSVLTRVDESGDRMFRLRVIAPSGQHVWFFSSPLHVWSRPLAAIASRVESGKDTSAHPELGGGFEARWITPEGVIVKGRASNEYLLTPDGRIEKTDWTFNTMRYANWRYAPETHDALPRGHVSVRTPDGQELRADVLPLEAGRVLVAPGDLPLLTSHPRGALVVGGDLKVPQGYPRIDRIALVTGAEALWSTSAQELFDEPTRWGLKLAILGIRVLAAQATDAGIELVLRAKSEKGEDELRFVLLDTATGKALRTQSLAAVE